MVDLAIDPTGDGLIVDPQGDLLQVGLDVPLPTLVKVPPLPQLGPDDFLGALQALMPRGRAWPKDPDAVQTQVLSGLAPGAARLVQAAADLLNGAFPPTTIALLPEWEETLGLPDPCAGPAPTIQARQAQVAARFTGHGGQTVLYYTLLALTLGYQVTITEYTGTNAHHWQINCPSVQSYLFRAGKSHAGEPLVSGGNAELECLINEYKPAHTTVSFNYSRS